VLRKKPPDQKQAAAAEVEISVMRLILPPARRREANMLWMENGSIGSTVLDDAGGRVCSTQEQAARWRRAILARVTKSAGCS